MEVGYVPVPINRLAEVMAFVAGLFVERGVAGSDSPQLSLGWDKQSLRRMWSETEPNMREMLRIVAEASPNGVTTRTLIDQIHAWTDGGGKALGGAMSALARRCRNRYNKPLPFERHWDRDCECTVLVMPPGIAAILLAF